MDVYVPFNYLLIHHHHYQYQMPFRSLCHGAVWNVGLTPILVALPRDNAERHDSRAENNSTEERRDAESHG